MGRFYFFDPNFMTKMEEKKFLQNRLKVLAYEPYTLYLSGEIRGSQFFATDFFIFRFKII